MISSFVTVSYATTVFPSRPVPSKINVTSTVPFASSGVKVASATTGRSFTSS